MTEREKMIEVIAPYVSAYGDDDAIADDLIEAGIGDISAWKHRTEVAERALLFLCDKTMSDISVMVFPNTKTQVANKQELYDYCIKQAEREMAEEKGE